MLPYLLIFLFNVLFITRDFPLADKKKNFILLLVVNTLFVGLRDMIGGFDIFIYSEVYEAPSFIILNFEPFEKGFRFLFVFLKLFSDDRQFMLFFLAMSTFFLYYHTLKKYSPMLYFSAFLFFCKFFLFSFVYLRQEVAMVILLLSFPFIIKRNLGVYLLFMVAAFYMHKSALIFLPVYFIYNFTFQKQSIVFISVIFITIALSPFSDLLLASLVEQVDDQQLENYFNNSSGLNIFYIIETLVLFFLLIKYKLGFDKVPHGRFFFNGFLFYIFVTFFAVKNASFIRFSWYYIIFVYIGMAYIYTFIQTRSERQLFLFLTVVYFSALFFRLLFLYDGGDFMPYKMFFQDFDREGMFDFMEYRN